MSLYGSRGSDDFDIVFEVTCSERTENVARAHLGVLVNNDVRHMIMKDLDLRSIQNLERGLYKRPKPPGKQTEDIAVYRFRVAVTRYFADPSEFAKIMLQTGTIIGGSTALSIIAGGDWAPGDLDLIVTDRYLPRLSHYLVGQGFIFDEEVSRGPRTDYVENPDIEPPLYKFAYHCFMKGDVKIDVSECFLANSEMTPANFVLTYHMSFVMNFVSGEGMYCLFPNETFNGRGYRNLYTMADRFDHILPKYAARGYKEYQKNIGGFEVVPIYLQERFECHDDTGRFMVKSLENIWSMKLPLSSTRNRFG